MSDRSAVYLAISFDVAVVSFRTNPTTFNSINLKALGYEKADQLRIQYP
jgi:hypothetical protein